MSGLPIRIRVAAAFAVALAVVLAATGWFLYARLESHLTTSLDIELRVRAQDLANIAGTSLAREGGTDLVERGESYAQLLTADGTVVTATPPLARTSLLSAAERRDALHGPLYRDRERVPGLDEASRFLASPVTRGGRRFVLVVGRTRQDDVETLAALRDELLISGPIALLLASLAGYLLAGVSLRQVEAMRRRAAEISADTPGERLPVPATGDELQRLGETLNEMLTRLESSLERERAFVADAGHELRTPLALLRTELELALRYDGSKDELREALAASAEEVDRLTQLAEDLLLIARTDRGKLQLDVQDARVGELFDSIVNRFRWRADAVGRGLETEAVDGQTYRGDRIRLEQALGNLVDNALRHGTGAVRLAAVQKADIVELHVTDEGPGFGPDFLDHAFERFSRARPSTAEAGAGLGLAIVRAIAEAHGGAARVSNRTGGGADVSIAIPKAPPAGV